MYCYHENSKVFSVLGNVPKGSADSPFVSVPYCIRNPLDWQNADSVRTVPRTSIKTAAIKNQDALTRSP